MGYKFEKLEVWQLSLTYCEAIYSLCEHLPSSENYNLRSQICRAATSVTLNIAEGSTGQSDPEQARFLGFAIRSLIETVACLRLIDRLGFVQDDSILSGVESQGQLLFRKLLAMRKAVYPSGSVAEGSSATYGGDE